MNYQPNDVNSVKLLICYLLYHLEMQITPEELYDIAVDSGTINYFHYNEALDELLINDTILSKIDENGKVVLSLSEKGITYVKDFSTYVQRSFRDRLMHSAIQYKAQQLKNASLYTDYEELENGCNLICRISDNNKVLVDMKLFTGSRTQAELISEKISTDPSNFYSSFIYFILSQEPPFEENNI
ncbi:MAG: DUF4364 family protein [Ruminococcus sp.]|nr:DUF4364 family protein [Ruminococcus sp.]